MKNQINDTIVAPATAKGEAAVAIVRLSGKHACRVSKLLTLNNSNRITHKLYKAKIYSIKRQLIDEGMIVHMHAPNSYTGEDVVEFQLHGSNVIVNEVLTNCINAGARLAEPGEFTLRAFLNGRIDLTQAEAVCDLIAASDNNQRQVAAHQLLGNIGQKITAILDEIEGILANWQAKLDFPEQVGEGNIEQYEIEKLNDINKQIEQLINGARLDLYKRHQIVLAGAPNVGKSSLLNILVGKRRVLVDEKPGTTRDPIEAEILIGVNRITIWDTAGIRQEAKGLEKSGIELTMEQINDAHAILWLVSPNDYQWPPKEFSNDFKPRIKILGSKSDLTTSEQQTRISEYAQENGYEFISFISSKNGQGIDTLRLWLKNFGPQIDDDLVVIVRERHLQELQQAKQAINRTISEQSQTTLDILEIELETAAKHLGNILGREIESEVLDKIFAQFCLGK